MVIGDGVEKETAADKFQDFQFWKIAAKRDLTSLATAINLKYMWYPYSDLVVMLLFVEGGKP